jgi:hypothetical protein
MTKSNQSSLDIADHLSRGEYDWCPEAETRLREQHDFIRQQHAEIEALKKEAALQRLSDFTQEAECKHGVDDGACKECYQESTEPVALTQVEIMNALTLGIPLYTHPVKELHLSLQKSKQTGELLAVTYTDDEHRIVEVLWQRPPVKELTDEEINWLAKAYSTIEGELNAPAFARAILRKASE